MVMMNLPVVFCLDRAGIVGEDGPTHHGVFDITFLRMVPGIEILAPRDEVELEMMLTYAARVNGPVAIRYPRGTGIGSDEKFEQRRPLVKGRAEILREGSDVAVLALGSMLVPALQAAEQLEKVGISARVVNPRFVKPFDKNLLAEIVRKRMPVVTLEEHALAGGFGSMILEQTSDLGSSVPILRIGIPDDFVQHGSQKELRALLNLDAEGIYKQINNWLGRKNALKVAV